MRRLLCFVALCAIMAIQVVAHRPAPASAATETPPDWTAIEAEARGQTVYWNAWGGGDTINAYIAWAGERLGREKGVELVHVKLNDTAEAVRKVLAEKAAGRNEDGSVDMIWINGENFKAMKDAGLLYGPFTDMLPNFALIDPQEKPTTRIDFTVPTEGLEAPWGMAKLVLMYDTARLSAPPRSIAAMLDHARANPGRLTYPAPPDFTGTTFLKQALYELVDNPAALQRPAGADFAELTAHLWAFLDEFDPLLWRGGRDYPKNHTAQMRLLDDGEVDLALSFHPGEASAEIAQGKLPDSVRTYVLDRGTIGNTHFLAIPYNAPNKAGAMVAANFLMSPEAQLQKQNPEIWGDQTVLTMALLSDADRTRFEAQPRGIATLSPAALGITLPEPHPSWMIRIESHWLKRYGS